MERVLQSVLLPHSAFPTPEARTAWLAKGGYPSTATGREVADAGLDGVTGPVTAFELLAIGTVDRDDEGEIVDLGDGVRGLKFKAAPEPEPEVKPADGNPVQKCLTASAVASKYYDGYSDRPHGANCLDKMADVCRDHYKTVENDEVAKFFKETGTRCKSLAKKLYGGTDIHKQMPDDWDEQPAADTVQKSPAAVGKSADTAGNVVAKGFAVDVDQLKQLNAVADRLSTQLKSVIG